MAEAEKSYKNGTSTSASQVTPKKESYKKSPGKLFHEEESDMNLPEMFNEDLPSDGAKGVPVHSLHIFKAGLTKEEFTKSLESKLKVLAKSCDMELQLDEVCRKRVANLSAYITYRETKKDKIDKRETKSNQSFLYIQKCLKEEELVSTKVKFDDCTSPSVVDRRSRQAGSGLSLSRALAKWYHNEQKKLLMQELDDQYSFDEEQDRLREGKTVLSTERFIQVIDQQIIKWWNLHSSGRIRVEPEIYQKLLMITKLVFHVTIGRYYVYQLTPSDLFEKKPWETWKNHGQVLFSFAAFLAVLEVCITENSYVDLGYFVDH